MIYLQKISQDAFIDELQKIADSQIEMGEKIESEHLPTLEKIKASIKNGKITMKNEDVFRSIAYDHLHEEKNPDRNRYYTLLKKYVDKSDEETEKTSEDYSHQNFDKLLYLKEKLMNIKSMDHNPFDRKVIDIASKGIDSLIPLQKSEL